MNLFYLALTACMASMLGAGAALAASCPVAVAPGGATITLKSGAQRPFDTGLQSLDECDGPVRVASGKACFFVDEIGAVAAKCVAEIPPPGQTFAEKRVQSAMKEKVPETGQPAAASTTIIAVLIDEASGRQRKVQGGKKAQDGEALAGFPYGEILAPQGELVISTKAVSAGPVTAFTIEDKASRKKIAATLAGNTIRVPGREIVAGRDYGWSAIVAGAARVGSFSVTTLANEPELSADLATAAKSPALAGNPAAMAATRAAILHEHQFMFDAIRAIDAVVPARP